jgi:hypothetical protein
MQRELAADEAAAAAAVAAKASAEAAAPEVPAVEVAAAEVAVEKDVSTTEVTDAAAAAVATETVRAAAAAQEDDVTTVAEASEPAAAAVAAAVAASVPQKVSLFVSCAGLCLPSDSSGNLAGQCDPTCALYVCADMGGAGASAGADGDTSEYVFAGQTEALEGTREPTFNTPVVVPVAALTSGGIKLCVFNTASDTDGAVCATDMLGGCVFSGSLLTAGRTVKKTLVSAEGKPHHGCEVTVTCAAI